jgi:enoyl-[acyl-carrier-protein] reductase (NADH)
MNIKKLFTKENSTLRELLTAQNVANTCYFLSSQEANSIIGQSINVDSGVFPQ